MTNKYNKGKIKIKKEKSFCFNYRLSIMDDIEHWKSAQS